MSPPSHSWAESRRASSTTIPGWPWPGYWGTTGGSVPSPSQNSSPTTCSRTGSAVPARATTKARWKAWWDCAAQLPGAHPVLRELRRPECSPRETLLGAVGMGLNVAGVNHQPLKIRGIHHRFQHPGPLASVPPAAEAAVSVLLGRRGRNRSQTASVIS